MNFAPYQDQAPESTRALSPPPPGQGSTSPRPQSPYQKNSSSGWAAPRPLPPPDAFEDHSDSGHATPQAGRAQGPALDVFETSLPLRLDYEACLAYIALPPAGGALLLLFEHKSDYVRFHAWQSSLVFTALFVSWEWCFERG